MSSEKAWVLAAAAAVALLAVAGMVAGPAMLGGGAGAESTADDDAQGIKVAAAAPEVIVYKTPTCGCCNNWVEHMRAAGFKVTPVDVENDELLAIKRRYGVAPRLSSCHTAVVGDYVLEGHVPADLVVRLLGEGTDVRGLAVPGMPIGSPGMEVPGRAAERYDVLSFDADGKIEGYASR